LTIKNSGLFIALEGLDGAGKTTLAHKLCDYLKEKQKDPLYVKEPTNSSYGLKIRELSKTGRLNLSPANELELFVKDRAYDVKKNIKPALLAGRTVIADRYIVSNLAYQGALGLSSQTILKANQDFPWPNLTIILDIEPGDGLFRVTHGRGDVCDKAFENKPYLTKVKAILDSLDLPGLYHLEAQKNPLLLLSEVIKLMESLKAAPMELKTLKHFINQEL
jgi:dTMP kinase